MRISLCKLLTVVILVFYASSAFAEGSLRIAVLKLKAEGISESTSLILTSIIRNELINSDEFTVIEREQMEMILKEQSFQQTGCTDQSCAVKIGKILSVQKMVIGEAVKSGEEIMLTLRLVDVEKGLSEQSSHGKVRQDRNRNRDVRIILSDFSKKITGKDVITVDYGFDNKIKGVTSMLSLSYFQQMPVSSSFSSNYSNLFGVSASYIGFFHKNFSFQAGVDFLYGTNDQLIDASMFINTYSAGLRAGIPLFEKFYLYGGALLKGSLYHEKNTAVSADYFAFAIDGIAGVSYLIYLDYGIQFQYNYSWGFVNDETKTDISSHYISAGVIYRI